MTIVDAFKSFVNELFGVTPVGDTISEVVEDSAAKIGDIETKVHKSILVKSSESDKVFEIEVDDSGVITATEVGGEVVPPEDDDDEGGEVVPPEGDGDDDDEEETPKVTE